MPPPPSPSSLHCQIMCAELISLGILLQHLSTSTATKESRHHPTPMPNMSSQQEKSSGPPAGGLSSILNENPLHTDPR
ncbi:hypothetical protein E4U41_004630, partial [Claviceps citrina]